MQQKSSLNSKSVSLYFIRHGQTDWNAQNLLQGQEDIPLNAVGIKQAYGLSELLKDVSFDAVLSSDLSRAEETARIVCEGRQIPFIISSELRERAVGALGGTCVKAFNEKFGDPFFLSSVAQTKTSYFETSWHDEFESSSSVYKRVHSFLETHLETFQNKCLLVSTHGAVIRTLLDQVAFIPKRRWMISNCGYVHFLLTPSGFKLVGMEGVFEKNYKDCTPKTD